MDAKTALLGNLVAGRPPDATPKRMICVSHAGPRALLMFALNGQALQYRPA
jgi:hypothetical protein